MRISGGFAALIDKETLLIRGFGGWSVLGDVELEELRGPGFKRYKPEAIPFAQDGQCLLLGVEVIQVERGDFAGSGP